MNKRGLSAVVASLLIVLITIAAVLLIWGFVRNNIEKTGTQLSKADCINVDVKINSCTSTGIVTLSYNGGDVSKLVITTTNGTANNVTELTGDNLPILGSQKIITSSPALKNAESSVVTAFLEGSDEAEISCGVVSEKACA